MNTHNQLVKRLSFALVTTSVLLTSISRPVAAITTTDLKELRKDSAYYSLINDCTQSTNDTATLLPGGDNKAKIFNFFIQKGLTDYQAAGILGNIQAESGFMPQRFEGTGLNTITTADEAVAKVIENNKLKAQNPGKYYPMGWGIVQWTPATKFIEPAKNANLDPNQLSTQLEFLWEQLNSNTIDGIIEELKATKDEIEAANVFGLKYERYAGDPQPARAANATTILGEAKSGGITQTASTQPTTELASTNQAPVIYLDPGHGGPPSKSRTDPTTGLQESIYANEPEQEDVWNVALQAKSKLETLGYRVLISKDSETSAVYNRERADAAAQAKASIGVSIHSDGAHKFGEWQQIYTQKVGLYRGEGENKTVFEDKALAEKSKAYAESMKKSRDSIEVTKGTTDITDNNYDGRGGDIEKGNIPLVSLFATVPWIYLEAGGNSSGLSDKNIATYAEAIADGISKAVPIESASQANQANNSQDCISVGAAYNTGDFNSTLLAYAWPTFHPDPYFDLMPAYAEAIKKAQDSGWFVGGDSHPGVDCGAFVTRLLVDSGFIPGYNYGGIVADGATSITGGQGSKNPLGQLKWARENMQEVGAVKSTSQLQPGDVAIKSDGSHTFIFVGTVPGFEKSIASASLNQRSPMAGSEDPTASDVIWYRRK